MTILIQLILYCLLFTAMVKFAVRGGAIDGLYFYPRPVQERAIEIGLTTKKIMQKKRRIFMAEFYIVMLAALVLIIGLWNRVSGFKAAYLLALLFLEVMNVYDGIVIDKIWVGHSKFWLLPGCEDLPYVCCEIDYLSTEASHGVLHRDYTLATGGSICDYWIVPDKIVNPQ